MKFHLSLDLDNDAFQQSPVELERILTNVAYVAPTVLLAAQEQEAEPEGYLFDMNGNKVGRWQFKQD